METKIARIFTYIFLANLISFRCVYNDQDPAFVSVQALSTSDIFGVKVKERLELNSDIGFTSVSVLSLQPTGYEEENEKKIYLVGAGTKRGGLEMFAIERNLRNEDNTPIIKCGDNSMGARLKLARSWNINLSQLMMFDDLDEKLWHSHSFKPYPIYSMQMFKILDGDGIKYQNSIDCSEICIALGGGDRYLTILSMHTIDDELKIKSILGPHTGWVKDIIYMNNQIHSIGCNCIESWGVTDSKWIHLKKRAIESSPDDAATLSSDLLCLCQDWSEYPYKRFYSGGVDGRIHQWSENLDKPEPIYSARAHEGRVSCIVFSDTAEMLLSASYDGTIQCRSLQNCQTLENVQYANSICIQENSLKRLSSIEVIRQDKNRVYFFVGTTDGFGAAFLAERKYTGFIELSQISDLVQICPDGIVYALKALESDDSILSSIAIAHSKGLVILSLDELPRFTGKDKI